VVVLLYNVGEKAASNSALNLPTMQETSHRGKSTSHISLLYLHTALTPHAAFVEERTQSATLHAVNK